MHKLSTVITRNGSFDSGSTKPSSDLENCVNPALSEELGGPVTRWSLCRQATAGQKLRRNKSQRPGHMEFDKTVWMESR